MLLTALEGGGRRRRRGEAEIVGAKWSRRLRLMRARQNMRDGGETGGEGGGEGMSWRRKGIEGRGVAEWHRHWDVPG